MLRVSQRVRVSRLLPALPALLAVSLMVAVSVAPVSAAKTFINCTALNKVYPHGVGKPDAVHRVSGDTRREPGALESGR